MEGTELHDADTECNMNPGLPKRKSPAHPPPMALDDRAIVLFVTVCTKDRRPLLANEQIGDLLISWWQRAETWLVGRYVLMPDHLHLFCGPSNLDSPPLKKWVQFWKAGVTREWPEIVEKPIWQRNFWDRQLRSGESYDEKWEYVRWNPCRHGFVERPEDWPLQGELNVLEWRD